MVRSIRRHPLVTFFLLAFALTWVVWVPRSAGVPVGAVGQAWTWIPAIAALLAADALRSETWVRAWCAGVWAGDGMWWLYSGPLCSRLRWRGPACFWGLLVGRSAAGAPQWGLPGVAASVLVGTVPHGRSGRRACLAGFCSLPRLLSGHNALAASLILGVLWALWHLPLFWTVGATLFQQPLWLLLTDITAKSILFTWVFLHTRGSVLLAILFHASTNLFEVSPVGDQAGGLALPLLAAAKLALVAVIIAVAGPALAKGPRPEALSRA